MHATNRKNTPAIAAEILRPLTESEVCAVLDGVGDSSDFFRESAKLELAAAADLLLAGGCALTPAALLAVAADPKLAAAVYDQRTRPVICLTDYLAAMPAEQRRGILDGLAEMLVPAAS